MALVVTDINQTSKRLLQTSVFVADYATCILSEGPCMYSGLRPWLGVQRPKAPRMPSLWKWLIGQGIIRRQCFNLKHKGSSWFMRVTELIWSGLSRRYYCPYTGRLLPKLDGRWTHPLAHSTCADNVTIDWWTVYTSLQLVVCRLH